MKARITARRKAATVALCAAAAGSAIATATPAGASTPIYGTVYCADGLNVVGVWIQAASGGSGFATYQAGTAMSAYHYTLPYGGWWTVHVGCGGSTSSWKYTPNGNSSTTRQAVNWYCRTPDSYGGGNYCFINN